MPPSGHGERKAEPAERRPEKSVLYGRDDLGSTDISWVGELSRSATWPRTPAPVPRSPLEASAGTEIRCAAMLVALSSARYWASVAAASLGLSTVLAVYGDRKEEEVSKANDWGFVALVLKVPAEREPGMVDLSPGDLRFILAS